MVEARILGPLIFMVIVGTVVIQRHGQVCARWLGVSEADPQGFLIMGANRLAQEIGLVLKEDGYAVRLIDANHKLIGSATARPGGASGQSAVRLCGDRCSLSGSVDCSH